METGSANAGGRTAEPLFGESWRRDWNATLGSYWAWLLAGFAICLFIGGATVPLNDADLSMHLAIGEWVVEHRAVPFVEPFAWTRAGDAFYAYSWGIETLYFAILKSSGPVGLHVLHGLTLAATAAAIVALGAAARWSGWTTLLVTAIHLVVSIGIVPSLRPQGVLLVLVPLAWALAHRVRDGERITASLVGLFVCAVIAANTHLFFPLIAVPGVVLLSEPRIDWRRVLLFSGVVAAGWMVSPYALHWVDVFQQNFTSHAPYRSPSPIDEYMPGFASFSRGGGTVVFVAPALMILPWLVAGSLGTRERVWYGFLWMVGLLAFGVAFRGILLWWLVMLPLVGIALGALESPAKPVVLTTQRALVTALFGAMTLLGGGALADPWERAGTLESRRLPSVAASGIEPIAEWLDCNVKPVTGSRLLTTYNFGGYARWRMPYLSESIDGRTIFPDSVGVPETYFLPVRRTLPLPPWKSAELAILPVSYPVAAVLDTAAGWRRVGMTADRNGAPRMIGLWVTEQWWARAGRAPIPVRAVRLFHVADGKSCLTRPVA
jgi:hypothetical protein